MGSFGKAVQSVPAFGFRFDVALALNSQLLLVMMAFRKVLLKHGGEPTGSSAESGVVGIMAGSACI